MHIGITGANGFLGTNLVNRLAEEKINVVKFPKGADVRNPKDFEKFALDCEWVVHLAGCNRSNMPDELLDINVLGVYNVAKHCLKHKKKLIVSGSRNRFGMYGASKSVGQKIISQLCREGLEAIYLNLPNLFGPNCRPYYNSFVTTMMACQAAGLPYTIDDPKKDLWLVHSHDVCENIVTMLRMDYLDILHNTTWQCGHKKTAELWHVGEFKISLGDFEAVLRGQETQKVISERSRNLILKTFDWYKDNARKTAFG